MSTLFWSINDAAPEIGMQTFADLIESKRDLINQALIEAMGTVQDEVYELIQAKLNGGVVQSRTGELAAAVEKSPVSSSGTVVESSIEIPEESPQWIVGMAIEYGHKEYEIFPLEVWYQAAEISGLGRRSPHSRKGFKPYETPYLPHVLAWEGPEGMQFARHVTIPEAGGKSFMVSSLEEREEQIYAAFSEAVSKILEAE